MAQAFEFPNSIKKVGGGWPGFSPKTLPHGGCPVLAFLARAGTMLFVAWDFGRVKTSAACGIAPTLRTEREEWGTHFLDRVREIERLGHPPNLENG